MKTPINQDPKKKTGKKVSKPAPQNPLFDSEVRYRRLFETTKDGILILDAETGMILDVNPFLIDLLGYSKEEFIEKEIWEIGFFKDIIDSKDKFEELKQKGYLRYENLPFETALGSKIDVEFISNLYFENNHRLIQCNIRDITKRTKKETGKEKTRRGLALIKKDADEVSEFAENIINTIREPLLLLNKELEVVKASRSFYDFFKVKPEETIGKLIYELGNHQWNIPKLRELLETILPEKTSFENYEVEHVFTGIGKRTMLLNARKIERALGMEKIILLAIEDITERKIAEDSLSEENRLTSEYLDILFNHAHIPIIIWDADSVITKHNRAFEELIGYGLTNRGTKKLDILFPKEKIKSSLDLIMNSMQNEHPELIEVEILTKDNTIKTVLWNSTNIFDKEGKKIIATVAQDITSRRKNEDALSVLETRYRRLFESAKDGILILDADTGRIIDVNPFLVELLGYTKDELVEKEIWDIGFFKDIAANEKKFSELQQKGYVRYDNLPLETTAGRKINVEFVSNVYLVNKKKVIQCNIRDITKRKNAENALIVSESRLRTLVQTIPDLIWTKDLNGVYQSCNPMFARFFGASEAEIIGKTDFDFVDKELADFFVEYDRKAIKAGKPTTNEEWITFADDGHKACLETIKAPMYDAQNKLIGILGIGRDITQRKNSEEALKQSEEKFRSYIDNAPDGIFVVDETGKYMDVNPSACLMSGYSEKELLNMSISDILAEESREFGLSQFNKLVTKGILKTDILIKLKDGSNRWWSLDGVKLSENRFLGFKKDITKRKLAEEEIIMLSLSLKSINECVSITDLDNKILFVNHSFLKTYGFSADEMIGQNISIVSSQNNESKRIGEILPETIKGEWIGELVNRKKDGSEFPVYLSTSVIKDKEGKILGLIGVATDITERKIAENELQEKNTFIQTVMDNLPIGISLNKIADGSAFYANKKFEEIYGWPLEEMKNITGFFEKVYPDKKYREELSAIVQSDILSGDISRMHWEDCKVTHKDGSEHIVNAVNIPLFGQNTMVSTAIDITERKRADDMLIKLSSAVEQTVDSIVITDQNGHIEYANRAFETMTGYSAKEVLGKTFRILKSGVYDEKYYEQMWGTILSGEVFMSEILNKKKNGDLYYESRSITPIFDKNNNITHFVSIGIDATERKLAEKELHEAKERAEESDSLKSSFLANMSHEIRTPMNGILGFTELLKEPKLTGEVQQEYIAIIEKSGDRMLNIINDIVNISKIESGQMEISHSDTNINETLKDIYTFFRQEAELKNIQLSYHNPLPDEASIIKTDGEKLYAILSNLVKNAIKFTDQGSIKLGYEKKDGYLEFFVKDTGIGVPKAQKEFIFERFRQGSESRTRNYEGAGLGLSISKAYVEMLGGKIRVESKSEQEFSSRFGSEKGSTFFFTIPYNPVNDVNPVENTELVIKNQEKLIGKLKILIADDDEISQMLVSIVTKSIVNRVITAGTGPEAVEACRKNPDIDLVLMDIKMPGMDGYEATRQIRKFNKTVVIIAQTAYGLDGDRKKAIEAGCNDYISKPVDSLLLLAMIKKIFIK